MLDSFGAERAHLVGVSLGGIIAQRIAVTDPERVLTLTRLSSQPLGRTRQPVPSLPSSEVSP
ncbi:hypothetical protein GCM10017771_14620 [Streptomyces capitiformicae]|uniref:AB hydrolase-1 domain-containing protein n=1 Tax=Streptomyces capitiformicae TaxID=2014920 RepID=A0A919GIS2_9ACTN|nr:hypothetical protein GCM10017771_14620 [Streptomyces capitiformicae]